MGDIVTQGAKSRASRLDAMLGKLAYERLLLQRRMDELDNSIRALEGARDENKLAQNDVATEAAIAEAQANKAAEDAAQTQEVTSDE